MSRGSTPAGRQEEWLDTEELRGGCCLWRADGGMGQKPAHLVNGLTFAKEQTSLSSHLRARPGRLAQPLKAGRSARGPKRSSKE